MRVTRRELFERAGFTLVLGGAALRAAADDATDGVAGRAADIVREYSREGFHRTATTVDRASADRLRSLARAAGVEARLEPFELSRVDPGPAFLDLGGRRLEGLPMFDGEFTSRDGIRAALGSSGSDRAIGWLPMGPNGEVALRTIRDETPHRALIVVTNGQRPGLCPINAAFFSEPFGPPVLQIGGEHRAVVEEAARGGATVRFVANATRRPATAFAARSDRRAAIGRSDGCRWGRTERWRCARFVTKRRITR